MRRLTIFIIGIKEGFVIEREKSPYIGYEYMTIAKLIIGSNFQGNI